MKGKNKLLALLTALALTAGFVPGQVMAESEADTGEKYEVSEEVKAPYFENIQFLSNAIKDYKNYQFSPDVTEYSLQIKTYSTKNLTFQKTTVYDSEKYDAYADSVDAEGENRRVNVKSGALTYLENISFDESTVKVTISDKENAENNTVYTYTVTRPRDTSKTIKNKTGITLVPDGRSLEQTLYNGAAEGTMFKADKEGNPTSGSGVSSTQYDYKCYMFDSADYFSIDFAGNTAYQHLRYSADDGQTWAELPAGGGKTAKIGFSEKSAKVILQILDDLTYSENIKEEKEGFEDAEPSVYTVYVQQVAADLEGAQIVTAHVENGEWYPQFEGNRYNYTVMMPTGTSAAVLEYTIPEGAKVTLGKAEQTPGENGVYTLDLGTAAKKLTVVSADGTVTNTYSFSMKAKKAGYPDKVVDFLCINSQYTNGAMPAGNATAPWGSLAGTYTSIGCFGGYITYYYEDAIKDDANHKYGVDFYVYGNANKGQSFFEPAQIWVSEDGETWYALAGSAHYDEGVEHNYSVTYTKTEKGKTAWTDSLGNSNDGSAYTGQYPSSDIYFMNDYAKKDSITLSGIMLPGANGMAAVSGAAVNAYPVRWGYADCFVNGTIGAEVNPYLDNSDFALPANGFDLAWAVDSEGTPVDVSGKEFHYIKAQTASNIWHNLYGEKSPEIAGVLRTAEQSEPVGQTAAPKGVTVSNGTDKKSIHFKEGEQIYNIDVGDMRYVSVAVNGAAEDDNIYINNTRVAPGEAASGFEVTKESGEKLVRIVVQNGEKEPLIYLLKLSGNAEKTDKLIDGIKVDVLGTARTAQTADGENYNVSVGYRINSVGIVPVAAADTEITINGEKIKDSYSLTTGKNIFDITAEKDGKTAVAMLCITKAEAPAGDGTVRVFFTLLGDEAHGDDGSVHTLRNGGLATWIPRTTYDVDEPATVLDVFEKALEGKYSFVNVGGNYISEIDGLAEFTNGTMSGWQYTINGKHPSLGVAEQKINDGDIIIFHYTDDYSKEEGSEKWAKRNTSGSATEKIEKYKVIFDTNEGSTVAEQSVEKGAAVTEPEEPKKDGYKFDGWFTDKELTAKYDFSQKVEKDLTLYAKWVKAEEEEPGQRTGFSDVEKGAWYEKAVDFVCANGVMTGVSETEFAPMAKLTRAMFVTVLYRMENEPETTASVFDDVEKDSWYEKAVAWANQNGIVNGVSETEFAPSGYITREQMAVMMFRYAKMKGYDVSCGEETNILSYEDFAEISEYAVSALQYAVGAGLMSGKSNTTINPKDTATRAETAAVLMRFLEKYAQSEK